MTDLMLSLYLLAGLVYLVPFLVQPPPAEFDLSDSPFRTLTPYYVVGFIVIMGIFFMWPLAIAIKFTRRLF